MYKIQKRDSTKPPSDIENYFLVKRGKERTLEEIALEKLNARRRELRLKLSEPLTKKVFIETLNSGSILNQYGVRYRRLKNDANNYDQELEKFISSIADLGNFGIFPTADERREILHPPFESFSAAAESAEPIVDDIENQTVEVEEPLADTIKTTGSGVLVVVHGNVSFAEFPHFEELLPTAVEELTA